MGSKSLLLLGLLLACALLIPSELAAARDLAESVSTSKENSKVTNGVKEDQYGGGYRGNPGGGYALPTPGGGYAQPPPRGGYAQPPLRGGYPQPPPTGGYPQPPPTGGYAQPPLRGGYPQPPPRGGGHCSYGCCAAVNNGVCQSCCSYRGQPMDTRTEAKP